ncbi:hypothetical protein D6C78_05798 [Aureobasidium pullulans]|uniref:HNH nuclease domain-containing protein n=1 Tax=Aureobasidium pullulans TaxID=5580 RepID=A0A4T0BVZ7_AURPU|nr:hypothetical protein D6C78_05798 [Aureobasidium pullulans]
MGRLFHETSRGRTHHARYEPVLMEAEYYFHVPRPSRHHSDPGQQEQEEDQQQEQRRHEGGQDGQDEYRYPVVPSFKHWRFPHSCLPPSWPQSPSEGTDGAMAMQAVSISSASQAVRDRDGSCRLSGFGDQIERAHLCPRSEVEWFLDQDMDRYNDSRSLMGNNVIDDLSNSLALRVDIHQSFDARNFVFVPKQDRWVAHFIANTRTLGATYHNTIVDLDSAVHPCFLLSRLAWAVLPMVANFLLRGHVRRVTIKQPQATSSTSTTSAYRTQDMTKHDLLAILNPPRARSQSPKKRDRPTELDNDNDGENGDDAENDSDMDTGPRKRIRHDDDSRLPSQTPNLSSTVSIPPSSSSSPENPTHERRRLAALRHSALLHQRPSLDRRHLICCDYSAAERDSAAGLIGSKEWDGAFLCWECLGGTRAEDDDNGAYLNA